MDQQEIDNEIRRVRGLIEGADLVICDAQSRVDSLCVRYANAPEKLRELLEDLRLARELVQTCLRDGTFWE